jgi:hypothetical protein
MATAFSKGQVVKVSAVVPQGPVLAFHMDDDGNVSYPIEWTAVDGVVQQRWFKETDLVAA